jgi:hypothetical protein
VHPTLDRRWSRNRTHTPFGYNNVQLSFSERTERFVNGGGVLCHSVDVDIDLARGLKHVVELLENNVFQPGKKTDHARLRALDRTFPHQKSSWNPSLINRAGTMVPGVR